MKQFNYENYVKNLPDCYRKSTDSNNFKLLETERISLNTLFFDIEKVLESMDIDKATGKTLDLLGEMVDQPRGLASDSQYRVLIRAKISRNIATGDYKSVVNALCMTFNCPPSEILIKEIEGSPCEVELAILPVDVINNAGFTVRQVAEIVESMLPVGVKLKQYSFEGTFMFTDEDWIETTTGGFASDDGTVQGGYLGTIGHCEGEEVLPV